MVFTYKEFVVDVVRQISVTGLGWPAPGDANNDRNLGCNREYLDLRRRSWADAKRVFALEGELITRVENAEDSEEELTRIDDELYENPDDDLFGLDLGVASSVVCLSAANCIPFTSCNAGAFGGHHSAEYPHIAFFTRCGTAELIVVAAATAGVGLHNGEMGCIVAYADDVRKMRRFAQALISNASAFNAIRRRASRCSR